MSQRSNPAGMVCLALPRDCQSINSSASGFILVFFAQYRAKSEDHKEETNMNIARSVLFLCTNFAGLH